MNKKRKSYAPIDLRKITTVPLRGRRHLVDTALFGRPAAGDSFAEFADSLPDILAARSLKEVAEGIACARRGGRTVAAAFGAHVIKCGLSPLVVDMLERGILTAVAANGAGAIHDCEVAMVGATSEDVGDGLKTGRFGMSRETAAAIAEAASLAVREKCGLGRALGELILRRRFPHADLSIFAAAARLGLPATVHVALGTDIVHMHPNVSPAELGEASMLDFRILCSVVADLQDGVWLNIGSAVLLPEVFLKALTVARNLRRKVNKFISVNMDMIQHYRPRVNVLSRPGGESHAITGHHEIMVPLLRMMVLQRMQRS